MIRLYLLKCRLIRRYNARMAMLAKREAAALVIQKYFRAHLAIRVFRWLVFEFKCATKINMAARGFLARRQVAVMVWQQNKERAERIVRAFCVVVLELAPC